MARLRVSLISLLSLMLLIMMTDAGPARAVDYEVGPGQPLAAIGDVPWETLEPGDRVLIHWRDTPYREKWVICRRGTVDQPIVVSGVPGPGGELPVISGEDAVTPAALNFWNEERGVIKIGGANSPSDDLPAYIVLENLDIRSGTARSCTTEATAGRSPTTGRGHSISFTTRSSPPAPETQRSCACPPSKSTPTSGTTSSTSPRAAIAWRCCPPTAWHSSQGRPSARWGW